MANSGWKAQSILTTAPSSEVSKNFGRYRDIARRDPVGVTNHGHVSVVIVAAEEYLRLKALDTRQPIYTDELPDDFAQVLDSVEIPLHTREFDSELKSR